MLLDESMVTRAVDVECDDVGVLVASAPLVVDDDDDREDRLDEEPSDVNWF